MKQTTVRMHHNAVVAHAHNCRDPEYVKAANAGRDLPRFHGDHEVWGIDRDLREAYEDTFGGVLEIYNAKQKNWSRRMTVDDYMEKIRNDMRGNVPKIRNTEGKLVPDPRQKKGKKLSYEFIVSVGNVTVKERDADGNLQTDDEGREIGHEMEVPEEVNRAVLQRYFDTFGERNPHIVVVRCDYHADEGWWKRDGPEGKPVWNKGTSHLHLEFFGRADGYKRGLPVRSAIGRALEQQGCKQLSDWEARERAYIEEITQEIWVQYISEHPDYAAELMAKYGSTGLEIVHPDKGKDDIVPLSAEAFGQLVELQETTKDARLATDRLEEEKIALAAQKAELDAQKAAQDETAAKLEDKAWFIRQQGDAVRKSSEWWRERERILTEKGARLKDKERSLDKRSADLDAREAANVAQAVDLQMCREQMEREELELRELKERAEKLVADLIQPDARTSLPEQFLRGTKPGRDGRNGWDKYQDWLRQRQEPARLDPRKDYAGRVVRQAAEMDRSAGRRDTLGYGR